MAKISAIVHLSVTDILATGIGNEIKDHRAMELLAILERDPLQNPPPSENLVGDLAGACSRRINIQHRLVYEIFPEEHTVRALRMWTHYE